MKNLNLNIDQIRNLTEDEVKEIALNKTEYKGYNLYEVNFENSFGYSVLVFKNNHHIYFANEYQLHHESIEDKDELKRRLFSEVKHKLFDFEDLLFIRDYDDKKAKEYWIRNYVPQEYDRVSFFDMKKEVNTDDMFTSYISFDYFYSKEPVEKIKNMLDTLNETTKKAAGYKYWLGAFKSEMFNHEFLINWQAIWDVFSCFGNVVYKGDVLGNDDEIDDYIKQLGMNDIHKKAFLDAYKQYYEVAKDYC